MKTSSNSDPSAKSGASATSKIQRYLALDAFRGFIMLMLAAEAFGFSELRGDPFWGRVASWFHHVEWEGAVFWDMIQPAFMFMVGVAMPFALAKRIAEGASASDRFKHIVARSLRLILMSQVLIWIAAGQIKPQLINVLSQIAFTYFLSYLVLEWRFKWQAAFGAGLLIFWTGLLYLFPGPDGPFSRTDHIGLVFDRWIFHYDYDPAYSTLNFLASTVWTLAGVGVGQLLMTGKAHSDKLKVLAASALLSFVLGFGMSPWIPMVKQICTPSFIFYSLGWVLVMMIGFFVVVEMAGWRKWTFPLVVVGANSIFIYSLSMLLYRWLDRAVGVFTFHYTWVGTLAPVAQACTVLAVMWYACYWLYQRRIFFKL